MVPRRSFLLQNVKAISKRSYALLDASNAIVKPAESWYTDTNKSALGRYGNDQCFNRLFTCAESGSGVNGV